MNGYPESRVLSTVKYFDRTSLAIFLFALALLVVSAGQVSYRLQLPTDGWTYESGNDADTNQVIFRSNLLGGPTPIQPGDELIAVEGFSIAQRGSGLFGPAISDGWQVGQHVRYDILRHGAPATLDVPLKQWTLSGIMGYVLDGGDWAFLISDVLLFAVGLLVLLKRSTIPSARALFLLGAVMLINGISTSIVPDGPTTQYSGVFSIAAVLSYWIWGILLTPTLFVLSLTFPRPKRILERMPWLVLLPYMVFWVLVGILGWQGQIGFGLSGVFFVLSLFSVIHSAFTQRDAVSRAQLLWGLGGFIALLLIFLPMFIDVFLGILGSAPGSTPSWLLAFETSLTGFGFPIFAACIAIAILRYRLYDIEVIIRRTLIYSVLTVILALLYFGSVLVLQSVFRGVTGQQSEVAIIISTLIIAGAFVPLRRRVQQVIDHRLYRNKYDAQQVLAAFAETARDEVDLEKLTDRLVLIVQATMQPASASVWLRHTPPPAFDDPKGGDHG